MPKVLRRISAFFVMAAVLALAAFAHTAIGAVGDGKPKQEKAAPKEAPRGKTGNHYDHLFGNTYKTTVDLYLFILQDDMDHLYLGRSDGRPAGKLTDLPAGGAANIGKTFGRVTILDFIPAGAEYTITAETHEVTALSGLREKGGVTMSFIGFLNNKGRSTKGVLAEFIQTAKKVTGPELNQEIDPAFATLIKP